MTAFPVESDTFHLVANTTLAREIDKLRKDTSSAVVSLDANTIPASGLPVATSVAPTDIFFVVVGGVTKTATGAVVVTSLVQQPPTRSASGAFVFGASDIGGIIHATGAGAQAATLNTLAASVLANSEAILTVQQEGAATQVTVTPDGASQIDGAGLGVAYVAIAGRTRFSLMSKDGTNWFSGKS